VEVGRHGLSDVLPDDGVGGSRDDGGEPNAKGTLGLKGSGDGEKEGLHSQEDTILVGRVEVVVDDELVQGVGASQSNSSAQRKGIRVDANEVGGELALVAGCSSLLGAEELEVGGGVQERSGQASEGGLPVGLDSDVVVEVVANWKV